MEQKLYMISYMGNRTRGYNWIEYLLFAIITMVIFVLCIFAGSVRVPAGEILSSISDFISGQTENTNTAMQIMKIRLPRVINVALTGAALALCGAAMQGLLRNPLADGSTLGVSSGASLGAIISIAFGIAIPGLSGGSTVLMSILFAFASLVLILSLAYRLDYTLATNTIILIGVVFTMFAHSLISMIVVFADEKVKSIMFWTMGSLAGSNFKNAATLTVALVICGGLLLLHADELNAFAIGEENARHIGVNVRRVKLIILIAVSVLIGVSVSIGGTIGFAGLVIPHIARMIVGPNHRRLLPASLFAGASFLMLADLIGRIILRPLELPIGVVTSFTGSIAFVYIFYNTRRVK